jgi:putative OPT family oligopeptide transporter
MLVGASFTLFKMRKQLAVGMGRAISDLKKSAAARAVTNRTERDLSSKFVFAGIALVFMAMIVLYHYFISGSGNLSSSRILSGSLVAAGVMIIVGFFFAAVSGNLVGLIGSSNNPVSGLALCTLVIAALLMALWESRGWRCRCRTRMAAVVCVSSAVAGEMLRDLKVGHILGGTPAKMQIGVCSGLVASFVLFPLSSLDKVYHSARPNYPRLRRARKPCLKGCGRDVAWPLVVVGILLGIV